MNDLETLRPEVREAINRQDRQERCDEYCPVCEDRATIRAELLRLADECATLKAQSIHPRAQLLIMLGHANERAEKAEGDLRRLANENFGMHLALSEHDALCEQSTTYRLRAERAQGDCNDLRKRLNDAISERNTIRRERAQEHRKRARERAEGELRRLADERDELRTAYTSASQSRDYWKECAGRVGSELAALEARIDGSRHAFLGPNMDRITFLAEDIGPVGKYALVKVED